ncbi:hypothetical protein [Nocardioides sp.]|uniref:hypothetical protein n=1 Tax=Nocardioides sp. TaxID=35761 RepID=UPI003528EFDC
MSEVVTETRITSRPSLGAKVCLVVAGLFLVAAAYQMLVPLSVTVGNGGRFECRSAAQGPRTQLAKSTCGDIYRVAEARAAAFTAAALVTAVGGFLTFGLVRRREDAVPAPAGETVDEESDHTDGSESYPDSESHADSGETDAAPADGDDEAAGRAAVDAADPAPGSKRGPDDHA